MQATPLLRELVISKKSQLTASTLVAALSAGSLDVLSIHGLEAGSASLTSLRALLAPDGVLDVARICDAPAQLRDAEEGSWMGRCNHLCAAFDAAAFRCDVCQVTYCSACTSLMEERNSWVLAKCDGAGCEATVCSRCVFASKHRGDADGEAHVASHCIACNETFCSDCAALRAAEADDDGVGGMLTCGDCGGNACFNCYDWDFQYVLR